MRRLSRNTKILLVLILVLAAVTFSNTLTNNFVLGWDDELQVTQNEDIRSLDFDHISKIFHSYYVGMYQPLTTLTYALDYQVWELNPMGYHLSSLLIHLINILLVFYLFYRLSGREDIPLLIAVLFAVHPMNVESIAWVSARSNLVYALFYLAALISYINYLDFKKNKSLIWSFVFFTLSLLSKAMAITLPFVLLLFDFYRGRKMSGKSVLEKLPFLLLSIVFAYIAFQARAEVSHLGSFKGIFTLPEQFILLTASVIYYLKSILFFNGLSPIHYYPRIGDNNLSAHPDWYYYAGSLLFLLLAGFILYLLYKAIKKRRLDSPVLFGLLFFALSISVVIHFVPIGMQIVAERYTYIPYLGLFYIAAVYFFQRKNSKQSRSLYIVLGFMVLFLSIASWLQNRVWKDTDSLTSSVIHKNPKAWHAYLVRADGYFLENKYQQAIADYNRVEELNPAYANTYVNRANVYARLQEYQKAVDDLNKALKLEPNLEAAYLNRAQANFNLKHYQKAIQDFDKCLAMDPKNAKAYVYRGMAKGSLGDVPGAFTDLSTAVEIAPDNAKAHYGLGVLYAAQKNTAKALEELNQAISLNPQFAEALIKRGQIYLTLSNAQAACQDFRQALPYAANKTYVRQLIGRYCHKETSIRKQ